MSIFHNKVDFSKPIRNKQKFQNWLGFFCPTFDLCDSQFFVPNFQQKMYVYSTCSWAFEALYAIFLFTKMCPCNKKNFGQIVRKIYLSHEFGTFIHKIKNSFYLNLCPNIETIYIIYYFEFLLDNHHWQFRARYFENIPDTKKDTCHFTAIL